MTRRSTGLLFAAFALCHDDLAAYRPKRRPSSSRSRAMHPSRTMPSPARWTLSAGGAALTLALDPSRDFAIVEPDLAVRRAVDHGRGCRHARARRRAVAGVREPLGWLRVSRRRRHAARRRRCSSTPRSGSRRTDLTVTRHYAIVPGSPSFEVWTTYEGAGASIADLNALQISVPTGTLHWLTGLQGDTADVPTDSAFTLQQQTLAIESAVRARRHAPRLREAACRGSPSTARATSSTRR